MAQLKKIDKKDGTRVYRVRWKDRITLLNESGQEVGKWKERSKTFSYIRDAQAFKAEVELLASRGETYVEPNRVAIGTIRAAALGWVAATAEAGRPETTVRWRSSMMGSWLDFLAAREATDPGADTPMSTMSLVLLDRYAQSLPRAGRKASTRHRKVQSVEQMWAWAADRPELYPGTPPPRRLTGSASEGDRLQAPAPVVATASPTWTDVDAMIRALRIDWHKRAALLMRFVGLRSSQVCGLEWTDFDLDRGILWIRARRRGAKRSRSRVVPLHPWLVGQLRTWKAAGGEDTHGLLFPRRYTDRKTGLPHTGPYRADRLTEPFRRAWEEAGVHRDRWDIPLQGGRAKGRPTHAIRATIRTELIRAGVTEALVLYLVGQTQGITAAAYVPESAPEQSPYWPHLIEAVSLIPEPVLSL